MTYPEEEYTDHVALEVSEYAAMRLDTDVLHVEHTSYDVDFDYGIHVTQTGSDIGLSAGTVDDDAMPHMYIHVGLTPDQARTIGKALFNAAGTVDNGDDEPDRKSFLDRLIERFR